MEFSIRKCNYVKLSNNYIKVRRHPLQLGMLFMVRVNLALLHVYKMQRPLLHTNLSVTELNVH